MPHVTIRLGQGRTEAERMACARAVAEAIANTLDVGNEPMLVTVTEAPPEEWTLLAQAEENTFRQDVKTV